MEHPTRNIKVSRTNKNLVIDIPKDLQDDFSTGAVAIRNRSVLEIMGVAVKPKVNQQVGRGASIYSPSKDNKLIFDCKNLSLPQKDSRKSVLVVKEKRHSLRIGIEFPILILSIDDLFNMA